MPSPSNQVSSASPFGFLTVAAAVGATAERWPDHGFTFQDLKGQETPYSFPQIERASAARAVHLHQLGLQKGDRLALAIVEPEDFVLTFFAAIRLGIIAVPIYPPQPFTSLAAYTARTGRILAAADAHVVVASASASTALLSLKDEMPTLREIVDVDRLREPSDDTVAFPPIAPDDVAFLQFTSGSTADPRGVLVTHACLIANAAAIVGPQGLRGDPRRDIGVTWLPLYHDMGLVGFVLVAMCAGISVVFIPTARFLRNPLVWMDTMHRHRATISYGPNFAYALATRMATPERLRKWDLSCIKVLGCGGEPVNPGVIRAFTRVFHEHAGLGEDVVRPGYGLAESTLTASLTPLDHGMKTLRVNAKRFQDERIVETESDASASVEHVSAGKIVPHHEAIVVDDVGRPLSDGREGHVLLRGPSVAPGYFNHAAAGAAVFRDGVLHTGDLGYLHEGYLYITGRVKDLIIYNGRNIHPHAIEWIAEQVEGSRQGNVVAMSVPGEDTERVVVVMETREQSQDAVVAQVKSAVQRELALAVDVICVRRGELPKTSSGKVQRRLTRQRYLEGAFEASGREPQSIVEGVA